MGDVIFRNESDNVIRKFKAKEARSKQATTTALIPARGISPSPTVSYVPDDEVLGDFEYSTDVDILVRQSPVSRFSLAPTLEDRATAYFVTNYTVNISGPTKGHLDFITAICGEDADEGLLSAMKAVGLAGFSHSVSLTFSSANFLFQIIPRVVYCLHMVSCSLAILTLRDTMNSNLITAMVILTGERHDRLEPRHS